MIRRTAPGPSQKGVLFMAQNPIVTIEMEDGGVMKAELYPDVAPNTVVAGVPARVLKDKDGKTAEKTALIDALRAL